MPLGDSITDGVGSGSGSGYRALLAERLAPHAGRLEFVGTGEDEAHARHEGHRGWRIDELSDGVERALAQAKPNVVLLHAGTNDMDQDYDAAGAPGRLGGLIDRITAAAPDVTVVVASLVASGDEAVDARVRAFDQAVPLLVEERRQKGARVGYVDMGALDPKTDLADRLHPNDAGYAKMADAFSVGVARAAADGLIREHVDVRPAPPRVTPLGDSQVDFDGDGKADYLVVDKKGAVRAWRNNGGDRVGWPGLGVVAGGTGAPGERVRLADVNGDRRADYLVVDDGGAVHAWLNKGLDRWSDQGLIATGTGAAARNVRFADIDGDGRADYVVVDDTGAVRAWLNRGEGVVDRWEERGVVAGGTGAPGAAVRLADINRDRRADYLVVAGDGSVRAWINGGGDRWADQGVVATGRGAADTPGECVRFSDVDGDGRADYLVVRDSGVVDAWLNGGGDGRGGWTEYRRFAGGAGPGGRVRV